MLMNIDQIEFQTAAELIAALERFAGGVVGLHEVYIKEADGGPLTKATLEQETLTDGSVVFNVILSEAGDPNS